MIVSEKALIKAMNTAKKAGGYRCWVDGRRTVIYTGFWVVECLTAQLPRKVLGLLVEHMGTLPENGDTWLIVKKDVQKEVTAFGQGLIAELDEAVGATMKPTPLTLQGYELWQEVGNGRMLAFDPAAIGLAEEPVAMAVKNGEKTVAAFTGQGSRVFVWNAEVAGVELLENVAWVQ